MTSVVSLETLWAMVALTLLRVVLCVLRALYAVFAIPKWSVRRALSTSFLIYQVMASIHTGLASSCRRVP